MNSTKLSTLAAIQAAQTDVQDAVDAINLRIISNLRQSTLGDGLAVWLEIDPLNGWVITMTRYDGAHRGTDGTWHMKPGARVQCHCATADQVPAVVSSATSWRTAVTGDSAWTSTCPVWMLHTLTDAVRRAIADAS